MNANAYSQQIYKEKIHLAVDFINEHLSEEVTLEQLAAIACFSPFHFHRIFTAMMGETPRDFIERVKLEKAANMLCLLPQRPVAEVAYHFGYSSTSTFTRAFKKYYSLPPRDFLAKHIHDFHSLNIPGYQPQTPQANKVGYFVKIERLPAMHVAYVQTLNGYAKGIPKAWNKLTSMATIKNWINPETRFIGIPYDNPGITPNEKCRYRACITVDETMVISHGDVKTAEIEEGMYTIFHFKGGRSDINKVYSFIYGEWLIQSGYIPDDKPTIEFYPPEMYLTCSNDVPEYTIALPVTIL